MKPQLISRLPWLAYLVPVLALSAGIAILTLSAKLNLPSLLGIGLVVGGVVGILKLGLYGLTHKVMVNGEKIAARRGLFTVSRVEFPASAVSNIETEKNLLGLLFGYGRLKICGSGGTQSEPFLIADVDHFRDEALRILRSGGRNEGVMKAKDQGVSATGESAEKQGPTLQSAKKQKVSDFGPLSQRRVPGERKRFDFPVGTYFDNGDGTVTHEESQLTWVRAPWGMVWNGSAFEGEPILMDWSTATRLFGEGEEIGFAGAELYGEQLMKSAYSKGYKAGRCAVSFAGQSDWRLPTAAELDCMAAYLSFRDPRREQLPDWVGRNWSWAGLDNRAAMQRLFPEWSRNQVNLWTATGVGAGTAYGFDGRFPVGDLKCQLELGVMLVRKSSAAELSAMPSVDEAIDYERWTSASRDGEVVFAEGESPKVGDQVGGGDLFAFLKSIDPMGSAVIEAPQTYARDGVIEEIAVAEGEKVRAGKRLVRVRPTQ
ncbi:PH domain-containing protein [Roseibacillus persicicus]|uniref:PH domain-containing protein n=1 Tax=Roseibacillus persicicus TaxID=454148 RepID=UPI00280CA022|nr:PH domain-containing protein [Roseibacillus persicicus]MDQ8191322.1 PH domain-containing protein [Roseibacillus persicicus]